jgi:hypothetical protein
MSERDRPAKEPGGCECMNCGVIFIGAEWHTLCGICVDEELFTPPLPSEKREE